MLKQESKRKIRYNYDEVADVLYSFVGKKTMCLTYKVAPGIYIHKTPKAGLIKGFTIVDYKKRKKRHLIKEIPYFPNIEIPY